ncbi:acetyl-CoA synthetase, putative [Ricinus communis]|uniref:Acetyl-CoA synthetase, putative n=1 Tax=Ricinus communis TaxID=3988 RepID=B9TC46_RICCO|nr:acetyl-CoA synthetase, putative [Ricinus communis]|eukprot:XP_002535815.1 uncharacterized protein LOC8271263 [Ricinus communis]
MLEDLGVERGDRVLVYMPMIPEAVVAMLACARIGAIHSVVFGGFAATELAVRIDDAKPCVVISASCGIEPNRIVAYKPLLDEALCVAKHRPRTCIIVQRDQLEAAMCLPRDRNWNELRDAALSALENGRASECVWLAATDPLYILYTSGTTGQPKGIVRDNGGYMVALAWSMEAIYGARPGDVYWAASDVGWVVGHSYIVYAPLLAGCTTVLYEGKPVGTPDAGAFWRVVGEYGVNVLFTAPTAIRAVRKEDPDASFVRRYDIKTLRTLFLAGERGDPETVRWAENALGVPVIDHWWQTETGWSIAANPIGLGRLPVKYGSCGVPMPGYSIVTRNEQGQPTDTAAMGTIVIALPLPPGAASTLWDADKRFRETYLSNYPGYYDTADAGYLDEDGYLWVLGRTDDVINVAGHRLSTGAMEEIVSSHPAVAECAVVGGFDLLKGEVPYGIVVLKSTVQVSQQDIAREVIELVRERIGPIAVLKRVETVARLPKTRSGKILRAIIKQIIDGETYVVPSTIEDEAVLLEIESAFPRNDSDKISPK